MIISLKNIFTAIAFFATALVSQAQSSVPTTDLIVPIPTVPENLTRLDERCNFLVDNFWKNANLKSAFSSLNKMYATLGQFLAFTPYADAKVVHDAIDRLIAGVDKADGKNLIKLARMAEKWTSGDSAEYGSEELFFPFVEAVANSRKVKDPEKARYQAIYRQLKNSRMGATPADFAFTCPDGSTGRLSDLKGQTVLLIFYEPDCIDCRLAKARLASDYVLPALIDNGVISVVAIYPGEADEEWTADALTMPDGWIVGAAPEIDLDFTINHQPEIYYLGQDRSVMAKGIQVDNAIAAFRSLVNTHPVSNLKSDSAKEEEQK